MADSPHIQFVLPDRSYQAVVRSELRKMAGGIGFNEHRLGELEIVIAEITSNLIKHAREKPIILARLLSEDNGGIELIAIDSGPGMRLPLKMMEDGQSTKKTLGQGLGAIQRLSNNFDLYSQYGWGTILWSRVFKNKSYKSGTKSFDVSVISVPKATETVCGDAWFFTQDDKKIKISVVDGLGHGASAHIAAQEATKSLDLFPKKLPSDQLKSLHENLKKTRGVVALVAQIDNVNQQLTYSGVGNISMRVISGVRNQGCFSYNGIIGHIMPASLNNHVLQWNKKMDIIIMHSDGITSRWDIKKYPGILQHNSIMLCAALYKDFCRGNDDATILIGKYIK